MKLKSFKTFVTEEIKTNMMDNATIKSVNIKLFDITPKDSGEQSVNIKDIFTKITETLDQLNLVMISDDFKDYTYNVITSKGQATILLANKDTKDELGEYDAYNNVALDVKWNIINNEYSLKSVGLKEIQQ